MSSHPDRLRSSADDLNVVARYLAQRELADLSSEHLRKACGRDRADVIVLVGSSLLQAAETVADAWARRAADVLLIAGGEGHSTDDLRHRVRSRYPDIDVDGRPEAAILADVLTDGLGLGHDDVLLETASTNCGENAAMAREVLTAHGIQPETLVVVQDPLMQRRTMATFEKAWRDALPVRFLSCPPFVPAVAVRGDELIFSEPSAPAWTMRRFLSLLMGEIPRLRDDERGYGPRGRGFIVHVDIPEEVEAAYDRLLPRFGPYVRSTT